MIQGLAIQSAKDTEYVEFAFGEFMMSTATRGRGNHQGMSLKGVDPETCMIVFKTHWAQVMELRNIYHHVSMFNVSCFGRNPLEKRLGHDLHG